MEDKYLIAHWYFYLKRHSSFINTLRKKGLFNPAMNTSRGKDLNGDNEYYKPTSFLFKCLELLISNIDIPK